MRAQARHGALRLGLRLCLRSALLVLALALSTTAHADTLLGPDDFEAGFGSWSNVGGDVFDWTRLSGSTSSGSTGPSGDHTSGSGFYLYTEASSPRQPGDDAILESPCIDLSTATDANLNFWYHMFGAGMGTLELHVASDPNPGCTGLSSFGSVFTQSGNLGDVWNEANVVLDPFVGRSVVIRFVGVRGSAITSDMAIDDVLLSATLPQSCGVPADCDDGNPCTDDDCNASVCEYSNNSASCDDGNACTTGDICSAGVCQPGAQSCGPIADYVIVFSVDGVNSDMLKSQVDLDDGLTDEIEVRNVDNSGDYHNWKRLVDEGVYTWNSRTDYDATITTPNHASMVTSYPVGGNPGSGDCDVIALGGDTDDHCYTNNGEPQSSWTLHAEGNPDIGYFPSMYDIAHDRGLSTSYFASKTKFVIFDQSYDASNGAPDSTGPDDGNDKIDRYYEANVNRHFNSNLDDALEMHLQFMWEMFGIDNFSLHVDPDVSLSGTPSQRFGLTTLHYVDPDKSGHSTGWPSADYYETLRQVDDYLGDVMNAIQADPILDGRTTLIVVTDHGGGNPFTHHSAQSDILNYKIPMFVWGAGAAAGAEFYSLNPTTRTDPGTGRPNFDRNDLNGQPIRSSDSGNLALSLMGLPPIPGSIVNSLQDLSIGMGGTCGDSAIDAGEDCDDGNTLPGDCCSASCQFESAGSECRASADACDVAETCSGSSGSCPVDAFAAGGTQCRASADLCDVAEQCSGAGPACPTDDFASAGTLCRSSAGACDAIEQCTGSSAACPGDGFVSGGTECRASAGLCDVAEQCSGSGPSCPSDGFASGGTECRAAVDLCDAAEQCTGSGASCPGDAFEPSGTECRPSAGTCDVAEQCNGSSTACPADGFVSAGSECRAVAGVCDVAEQCSGAGPACPTDGFASGTLCRGSTGACDAIEICAGFGPACPSDSFVGAGVECRGASGVCDLAEQCTGADPGCPADGYASSSTPCDDGVPCTESDTCDGAGSCAAGTPDHAQCDDGAYCNGAETCIAGVGCQPGPPPPGDGVGCTDDVCDEVGDLMLSTPNDANCENGTWCDGYEWCDPVLDCQTGSPPPLIPDGNPCTDAVCDEVNDRIEQVPDSGYCQNGDVCDGQEFCNPIFGCEPSPVAFSCDDADTCTADSCDAITGCAHTPIPGCQPVPAASPGGRALLSLLLLAAGATLLSRRRSTA